MKYEIGKRIKNGLYIRLYHSPLVDGWVANLWFPVRSRDINTSGLVGYGSNSSFMSWVCRMGALLTGSDFLNVIIFLSSLKKKSQYIGISPSEFSIYSSYISEPQG